MMKCSAQSGAVAACGVPRKFIPKESITQYMATISQQQKPWPAVSYKLCPIGYAPGGELTRSQGLLVQATRNLEVLDIFRSQL